MRSHFRVMLLFSERCNEWPQMTLACSRAKIPICMLRYTPWGPNVTWFRWPMTHFWITPLFIKVHWMTPNDLGVFKVKNTNMRATYSPEAQTFIRFNEPVSSCSPILWKVHRMTPKLPRHFQGHIHMHAAYIPKIQIFVPFAVRWCFWGKWDFLIPHWLQYKKLIINNTLRTKTFKIPKRKRHGDNHQEPVTRVAKNYKTVEWVAFGNFHSHRAPC